MIGNFPQLQNLQQLQLKFPQQLRFQQQLMCQQQQAVVLDKNVEWKMSITKELSDRLEDGRQLKNNKVILNILFHFVQCTANYLTKGTRVLKTWGSQEGFRN